MLLVTPTDYGTCADIAAVAEVCHEFGRPLIVDEACGAHLPFHPDLPPWAIDADADLCVTSVHKSGSAVEQSSVFHLQGDRVELCGGSDSFRNKSRARGRRRIGVFRTVGFGRYRGSYGRCDGSHGRCDLA